MMVPATRTTLAVLAAILPGGTVSTSGVAIDVTTVVGISMYDSGLPLFVRPYKDGVASTTKALRLEHTYPVPNFDVVFNLTDQRVYGVTFKAHPTSAAVLWQAGTVPTSASY